MVHLNTVNAKHRIFFFFRFHCSHLNLTQQNTQHTQNTEKEQRKIMRKKSNEAHRKTVNLMNTLIKREQKSNNLCENYTSTCDSIKFKCKTTTKWQERHKIGKIIICKKKKRNENKIKNIIKQRMRCKIEINGKLTWIAMNWPNSVGA